MLLLPCFFFHAADSSSSKAPPYRFPASRMIHGRNPDPFRLHPILLQIQSLISMAFGADAAWQHFDRFPLGNMDQAACGWTSRRISFPVFSCGSHEFEVELQAKPEAGGCAEVAAEAQVAFISSLITQRFDGIEVGGFAGGVVSEEDADGGAEGEGVEHGIGRDLGGPAGVFGEEKADSRA